MRANIVTRLVYRSASDQTPRQRISAGRTITSARPPPRRQSTTKAEPMFRWFEKQIDAFPDDRARPPEGLGAFYMHYVRPAWRPFAVLLVVGFIGSLIEVSL